MPLTSVAVFCGSSAGHDPAYARLAAETGRAIARAGLTLVTGGGRVGLMGVVADAAMAEGGEAIGVIPRGLFATEVAHVAMSRLIEVRTMAERKERMFALADAVIALPGGFGTLDETFEGLTNVQIGVGRHPTVLLADDGFWDPLIAWADRATSSGFLADRHRSLLMSATTPESALALLGSAPVAPAVKFAVE